jgi:hypothetical protein
MGFLLQLQEQVTRDVDEALNNYKNILDSMDSCCQSLLALSQTVNHNLFLARQAQDQLYDKCNAVSLARIILDVSTLVITGCCMSLETQRFTSD